MILTVHGFNTNPYSPNPDDHPTAQQCDFAKALEPYTTKPFNWYSAVQGNWPDIKKAWRAGRLHTYSYAYQDLAPKTAIDFLAFVVRIAARSGPVDVFAHSLGSRVVLQAARLSPKSFRRICLINAAERVEIAYPIIKTLPPSVKILNVCVKGDKVLDKLAGYCSPGLFKKEKILGQDGLLPSQQEITKTNYREIFLDDPLMQDRLRKKYYLELKGGGDHHTSYKHVGNHGLFYRFFNDELEL